MAGEVIVKDPKVDEGDEDLKSIDKDELDEDGNPINNDLDDKVSGSPEKDGEGDEEKKGDGDIDWEALLVEKDNEIKGLRQLSRDGKRDIDSLTVQVSKLNKIVRDANLVSEEDEEVVNAAREVKKHRDGVLDEILEVMKVNPKYEDIDSVVTQANLDDIVQAMSEAYIEENPKVSIEDAIRSIEVEIWDMGNPYKYLYDIIKEHHPDFVKGKTIKHQEGGTSLSDLKGGTSSDKAGWTTAKIDALDEDELTKVPADVYQMYMAGKLK